MWQEVINYLTTARAGVEARNQHFQSLVVEAANVFEGSRSRPIVDLLKVAWVLAQK